MKYKISYAQNREDIILSAFFNEDEKGFYVDVGANDPDIDSVTKLFYLKGWSGINIEPIKRLYAKLEQERPRDINLNVGVGEKKSSLLFREYVGAEGLSTFSDAMKEEYKGLSEGQKPYTEYQVDILPLKRIFENAKVKNIQFMKVDVEGFEYEVLKGNDWKLYRPEVICIESAHIKKDWHELLKKEGYEQAFNDGLNDYFIDNHKPQRLAKFSYIKTMLPEPVVPVALHDDIKKTYKEALEQRYELTRLELRVAELEQDNEFLRQEIIQSKRLRSLVKQSVKSVDAALIAYIDTLDKPRKRSLAAFSSQTDDAKELLDEIRLYDLKNNYRTRAGNGRRVHQVTRGVYMGVTRPAAKVARTVLHNLRERRK
jgi:FkbM family methyltransferase